MDVRMPDGVVVQNVPDDMDPAALLRIYQNKSNYKASDPTEGMSGFEKFAAGAGKAVVDTGRGLAQLASMIPGVNLISQADIDEAKRLDAPLMNTGAGIAGNVVGNLGMMVGPGAALAAAGKAANLPAAVSLARGLVAPRTILGGAAGGAAMSAVQPVASDENRLLNTALGGAVGGVSQGAANLIGSVLKPKAPLLGQEQRDLVQRALDLGYELKPSEITGKQWQRNLEAVMGQMPSTSGRMQAIGSANQQTTNRLVDQALTQAGGAIDQPSAAAAALEGWKQGLRGEKSGLNQAYRDVLSGTDIPLEPARPGLEALRQQQMALPPSAQTGDAMQALNDLLGSPNYKPTPGKAFVKPSVNPNEDDMVTAIRKLGGINPSDMRIGPNVMRGLPFNPDPRFGPVWSGKGHSLDDMAELLYEKGYLSDRNALDDVLDKMSDATAGKPSFSMYYEPKSNDPLANAIEDLTKQLGQKQGAPSPKAGYIRDNPTIPGDVAQALRSDYTRASASSKGRDKVLFGEMKSAIDGAIDAALPEASQGQFAAINRRYGIYAALNQISPKQQDAFLNQLYRGSNSPDQFYTFLGLAPEGKFKDVARGYLSRLVDKSSEQGNVSAARLGRELDRANPEALRYFGGDAGSLLNDVGNIGQNVLREQIGNPGTAQRLMYQGLLTGSGLGLGGYLGSQQGGTPGAVLGSALGAFALPKAAQAAYLSKTLRPLLTAGGKGRAGLLDDQTLRLLIPLLARTPTAGLLSLTQ